MYVCVRFNNHKGERRRRNHSLQSPSLSPHTHLCDLPRLLRPALRAGLPEHGLVVAARRKDIALGGHGHGHHGLLVPDLPDGLRGDIGARRLPQPERGLLLLLEVPEPDLILGVGGGCIHPPVSQSVHPSSIPSVDRCVDTHFTHPTQHKRSRTHRAVPGAGRHEVERVAGREAEARDAVPRRHGQL